tara:strand:+ start:950 stop:1150 length:201 start_codon:yes stop_codon:yes gene_type:complete
MPKDHTPKTLTEAGRRLVDRSAKHTITGKKGFIPHTNYIVPEATFLEFTARLEQEEKAHGTSTIPA